MPIGLAPLPPPPLRSGAGTFPPTLATLAEGDRRPPYLRLRFAPAQEPFEIARSDPTKRVITDGSIQFDSPLRGDRPSVRNWEREFEDALSGILIDEIATHHPGQLMGDGESEA